MGIDNQVKNWLSLAEYDFDTATMLKTDRYLYVVFTCQQCDIAVVVDRVPGKNRMDIATSLFLLSSKANSDIEPKCVFWDGYLNPEPASILSEILKTAKEIHA